MPEYTIEKPGIINPEKLDEDIRAALPEVQGISTGAGFVSGIFEKELSPDEQAILKDVIASHDPKVLTEKQQAEQVRKTQLVTLRAKFLSDSGDGPLSLESLAEKLAWLEAEIRDLRGL